MNTVTQAGDGEAEMIPDEQWNITTKAVRESIDASWTKKATNMLDIQGNLCYTLIKPVQGKIRKEVCKKWISRQRLTKS